MKFIFNFFFYGLLFFLISRYFPEVFNTLVDWVTVVWNFIVEIVMAVVDKIQGAVDSGSTGTGS